MNEAENEIKNIIENQDPAYRSFFTDQNELSNYNQRGSYFFGMGPAKALIKTTENAQTRGLRIELIPEYLAKSSAWTILTNREKTSIGWILIFNNIFNFILCFVHICLPHHKKLY